MPEKGGNYNILTTPDPQEVSFRIWVDSHRFRPEDLPADLEPFKENHFAKNFAHLVQYYGDYVFTYPEAADGGIWLYYAKNKTQAEANKPFEVYGDTRDFTWPAVLEDVFIVKTETFPQSVVTAADPLTGIPTVETEARYFPRFRFRPSTNHNSKVKVEQFLSPFPWPSTALDHPQPVPTNIDAYFVGLSINFERCLHGDVVFEELVPNAQILFRAGMVNPPASRNVNRQFFPQTNFTDWSEFVLSDRQQPQNGVWLREKVTIYPPPMPESIIR